MDDHGLNRDLEKDKSRNPDPLLPAPAESSYKRDDDEEVLPIALAPSPKRMQLRMRKRPRSGRCFSESSATIHPRISQNSIHSSSTDGNLASEPSIVRCMPWVLNYALCIVAFY